MGQRYFEGDGHKSPGWIPDDNPSGPVKTWEETKAEGERQRADEERRQQKLREERAASHWMERLINLAVRGAGFHQEDYEREAIERGKECLRLLRSLDGTPGTDDACRRIADSLMRGGRL